MVSKHVKNRLIIIGIDGLGYDILYKMLNSYPDKFRNFRYILTNGTTGPLRSTVPPWTIPAWISIHTGMTPPKFGIPAFMIKKGNRMVPFTKEYSVKNLPNVWDVLSIYDLRSIIFNVPSISKAYRINGVMVAGWLCTDTKKLSYPVDITREISKVTNGYIIDPVSIDPNTGEIITIEDPDKYKNYCIEVFNKHHQAFLHLLSSYKWDFAFVVYTLFDRIMHKIYSKHVISDILELLDESINDLMKFIDENTYIMLVSDHGFGQLSNVLYINNYLYHKGYLFLKNNLDEKHAFLIFKRSFIKLLYRLMKKLKLTMMSKKIVGNSKIAVKIRKSIASYIRIENNIIDWKRTLAFCPEASGEIYINIQDCQENIAKYYELREKIIEELNKLALSHGLKIEIITKEKAYPALKPCDGFPDLYVLPGNNETSIHGVNTLINPKNKIFIKKKQYRVGIHRIYGIFSIMGPLVKQGYKIKEIRTEDIAPLTYLVYNIPIPDFVDGKIPIDIFKKSITQNIKFIRGEDIVRGIIKYRLSYLRNTI